MQYEMCLKKVHLHATMNASRRFTLVEVGAGVTDAGLASLSQCKQLQTVDASECAGVTGAGGRQPPPV